LTMKPEALQEELQYRIESDRAHFGGALPGRNALAWHGYLSGLLEWAVIDKPLFDQLASLLPNVEDDRANAPAPHHPRPSAEVIVQELETCLKGELARSGSRLSEPRVIFWRAYLSGLVEWSVIYEGFRRLIDLLPDLDDDPAQAILTGRPSSSGDA
jgi:hypothetical protein